MHVLFPCGEREREHLSAATCSTIVRRRCITGGMSSSRLQTGGALRYEWRTDPPIANPCGHYTSRQHGKPGRAAVRRSRSGLVAIERARRRGGRWDLPQTRPWGLLSPATKDANPVWHDEGAASAVGIRPRPYYPKNIFIFVCLSGLKLRREWEVGSCTQLPTTWGRLLRSFWRRGRSFRSMSACRIDRASTRW